MSTAGEIETLIKLLNPNEVIGPDVISNRMLIAVKKKKKKKKKIRSTVYSFLADLSEKENLHFRGKNQLFSPY